jgi:hypothetical protein
MYIIVKFYLLVKEKFCFYCGGNTVEGGGVKNDQWDTGYAKVWESLPESAHDCCDRQLVN